MELEGKYILEGLRDSIGDYRILVCYKKRNFKMLIIMGVKLTGHPFILIKHKLFFFLKYPIENR